MTMIAAKVYHLTDGKVLSEYSVLPNLQLWRQLMRYMTLSEKLNEKPINSW